MQKANYYEGPSAKHIMLPFGDDFQYQNAAQNFINIDKLIKAFNEEYGDIRLMYSTPSCYVKALSDEFVTDPSYEWPTKEDDFFPYAESK